MPPRKACDVCFKRKIQCSIPSPGVPCDWCDNQKIPCTFTRKPQKKQQNRITPDAVYALSRRVAELEDLASKNAEAQLASPYSDTSNQSLHTRQTADSELQTVESLIENAASSTSSRPKLSHQQLGQNWYFRGMQILSKKGQQWIELKTGQPLPLQHFVAFDAPADRIYHTQANCRRLASLARNLPLPSKVATRAITDKLFSSNANLCFPVLDRTLFDTTVEEAYCPKHSLPAQACVWALHTWARYLSPGLAEFDIEICAAECRLLLDRCHWECSFEALQAMLLLGFRGISLNGQNNNLMHTIICQMVCELVGTFLPEDSDSLQDRKRRHIRTLFGLCYILDKNIALRSGRPPLLSEDYYDLTLMDTAVGGTELFHGYGDDLELSLVRERTCRLLYSQKAAKLSDGELLQRIRQLDDELEQWRLSIPVPIRPRLSVNLHFNPAIGNQQNKLIRFQLDYHYTLIAIHTMVRKCGASNEETALPEDLHSVVHSSVDLSLEAARSTLRFLRFPLRVSLEAFLYVQSYAPAAAMALFINVMVHPDGDSSQTDLETLIQAVGTFQSIPLESLSSTETQEIQMLNEYIMELVRLASCAIWKDKMAKTESN